MVGVDPVGLQVLKLGEPAERGKRRRIVEQELIRNRIGRDLPRHRNIAVSLERAVLVFGGKLDAEILALGVIERGEYEGLPELAVVEPSPLSALSTANPPLTRSWLPRRPAPTAKYD